VREQFEKVDHFLNTFAAQKSEGAKDIIELRQDKAERNDLYELKAFFTEQMSGYDAKLDKQRDDQLTLEHYAERYIPVQVQNMIIENLKRIHDDRTMKKIRSEENQVYMKMQRQLMDMTNLTDGTIFDNIIKINNEMTKKMNLRVDLRTPSSLEEEKRPSDPDKEGKETPAD